MSKTIKTKILLRNDTAANWTSNNPVLGKGQIGVEIDTRKFKFGDGTKHWNELSYGAGADIANATTTTAGLMSASDKVKLESITAGAQPNVVTAVTKVDDTFQGSSTVTTEHYNFSVDGVTNPYSIASIDYVQKYISFQDFATKELKGDFTGNIDTIDTDSTYWVQRTAASGTFPTTDNYFVIFTKRYNYTEPTAQTAGKLGKMQIAIAANGVEYTRRMANNNWTDWWSAADSNVNADWNATSGDAQILNKPTNVSAFTNDANYLSELKGNFTGNIDNINEDSTYWCHTASGGDFQTTGTFPGTASYYCVITKKYTDATDGTGKVQIAIESPSGRLYGRRMSGGNWGTWTSWADASSTTPLMNGTAAVGSQTTYARGDHVHPVDTSRAPTSHASTGTTYGKGTSTNYGHVKLSDSTTATTAAASGGTAATPKAVSDALAAAKSYTDSAIGGVTQFDYEVVTSLPSTGVKGKIYLVAHSHGTKDIYDEYIYVNNVFEKIGNTDIDLTNYLQSVTVAGQTLTPSNNSVTAAQIKSAMSLGAAADKAVDTTIPSTPGANLPTSAAVATYVSNNSTKVTSSSTNGNIKINGTETTVYTLPSTVVDSSDTLILDCGSSTTNYT